MFNYKCHVSITNFDGSSQKGKDRYALAGIVSEFVFPGDTTWYWRYNGITIEGYSKNRVEGVVEKILRLCKVYNIQVEVKYLYKD